MRPSELKIYRRKFEALIKDDLVLIIPKNKTNPFTNHLINTIGDQNNQTEDIIHTANKYINGDSDFVSFNRFIKTIQLISSIQSHSKSIDSINNELESMQDFIYIEYTFIPDSQCNQLQFPLKLYEIKVPKDADAVLLKQKLREKHEIPDEDKLYITDNWRSKIHREIWKQNKIKDIDRKEDDIFVYHKRQCQIKGNKNIKFMNDETAKKHCKRGHIYVVNNLRYSKLEKEDTAFAVPLLINFVDKRAQIPMNQIFERVCKIVQPLIKDENLKQEFDLALNMESEKIGIVIVGYIRIELEEQYDMQIPMELKVVIMGYTKFEIEQELPFEIRMCWGFSQQLGLENNADEIINFDGKRNLKFNVIWKIDSEDNSEYCERKNRVPIEVII